ncbi:MAG: SDR family oxidoreductase [Nitriliruptoraceae bacterium]
MDLGIKGRVAFVAASTAGLGLATARRLSAEGVKVVVAGRRGDLAASIASELPGAIGVTLDVTDPSSVTAALDTTRDQLGDIDILVLNSGGPAPGGPLDLGIEDQQRAAELLLYPHQRMIAEVIEHMRSQRWGRIVAVGSTAVVQPSQQLVLSSTFRAALAAYLKALAGTVAADGVTVNMVHPGRVATERLDQLDAAAAKRRGVTVDEVRAESLASIPIGRAGDPDEFGAVVTFLCSVPAAYVTGEQIRVDGGVVRGW